MTQTIVFDAYGTLFNIEGDFKQAFTQELGAAGAGCFTLWRKKYSEYVFTQSHFEQPDSFELLTKAAMEFAMAASGLAVDAALVDSLFQTYFRLQLFPDAEGQLAALAGLNLWIYSNGTQAMLDRLQANSPAALSTLNYLSAENSRSFKPSPRAYAYLETRLNRPRQELLFVSSNNWDIIGAKNFGFKVAWLNRHQQTFDPIGIQPDFIVERIGQLRDLI